MATRATIRDGRGVAEVCWGSTMADQYCDDWDAFMAIHREFLLSHSVPPEALIDEGHFRDFSGNGDFDYYDEKVDFEATRLTGQQAEELLNWYREWFRSRDPKNYKEDYFLDAEVPKQLSRHVEWSHFLDQHGEILVSSGVPIAALQTEQCFEDFYNCGERYGDRFGYDPGTMSKDQARALLKFFVSQGHSEDYFQREYFIGQQIAKTLNST